MLANGSRLGPYEIVAPLGAGGMGEVYRARDSRLGRDVAIKVLPQHLTGSADLRARFEREARTVSSLNHPHICTLFDVGREGDTDFLVMELVDGETLSDRLAKGPLPIAETLKLGAEIADALERAHRAGIVHRDLKPGNVMLTKNGAKLMDFGLARSTGAVAPAGDLTQSPTVTRPLTQPLTQEGHIVGTFQYMAPEQLEGREADARSDLWALGCVLYEMATGRRAFEGTTQASLISAIMRDQPRAISELAPVSPPALDRLVHACLAKDPSQRIQSAHDARLQLEWAAEGGSQAGVPAVIRRRRFRREMLAWAAGALGLLVAAAAWLVRGEGAGPVIRAVVSAPPHSVFLFAGDNAGPPVLSPDGTRLAFVAVDDQGGARLWVRELSSLTAQALPGTENATYPFWAPDGRGLGFFSEGRLMRVDLATRQVFSICPAPAGRGGAWSPRGTIVFAPNFQEALMQVSAMGGTPRALTVRDTTRHTTHRWPQFLPDGNHFLYFAGKHSDIAGPENTVWVASLDGRENRMLMPSATEAQYGDGYMFYVLDSVLVARPFDPRSLRFTGDALPTPERVQFDPTTWKANLTLARKGLLAYQPVGGKQGSEILLLDRSGRVLKTVARGGNHLTVRISRDGRRVVYSSQTNPNGDLYFHDIERDVTRRLTSNGDDEDMPVFSPDGATIAFTVRPASNPPGRYSIQLIPSEGGGGTRTLCRYARDIWPLDWSSDGRQLLVAVGSFVNPFADSIGVRNADGSGPIRWVETGNAIVTYGRFSHDGRWVAYCTSSPDPDVYIAPVPGAPASGGGEGIVRLQVSPAGGWLPQWRADDRELYYARPDGMIVAVPLAEKTMEPGPEVPLFRTLLRPLFSSLDMSGDGQRFLVNTLASEGAAPIVVVTNWERDLHSR